MTFSLVFVAAASCPKRTMSSSFVSDVIPLSSHIPDVAKGELMQTLLAAPTFCWSKLSHLLFFTCHTGLNCISISRADDRWFTASWTCSSVLIASSSSSLSSGNSFGVPNSTSLPKCILHSVSLYRTSIIVHTMSCTCTIACPHIPLHMHNSTSIIIVFALPCSLQVFLSVWISTFPSSASKSISSEPIQVTVISVFITSNEIILYNS